MESKRDNSSSDELLPPSARYFDKEPDRPFSPIFRRLHSAPSAGRRWVLGVCAFLSVISLTTLGLLALYTAKSDQVTDIHDEVDILDPHQYVIGHPTENFRDNLRNDTKYITSWISAGWTNDVMTYGNLLYLALLTERVPIIPKFIPSHIGSQVAPISFGEIFDVPRLSKALGKPILEWHQVKDVDSQSLDDLGCWSIWEAVQFTEHIPRFSFLSQWLKLDISYTPTPDWVKLTPPDVGDKHSSFWSLASLAFPEARESNLRDPYPSPEHQLSLPPDEQLLCYDYLYYVGAHKPFEYDLDYSPAWRFVGQHMRWSSRLSDITNTYVRRALNVTEDEDTPPFISIHMRHGDFKTYCNDIPLDQCYASLPVIARRVAEIQQELLERKGLDVKHIIMTSDEKDPGWWSDVASLGWTWIDYAAENTEELYGKWYPVLIDAVIQSSGAGFIGTDQSTMSILARRRVESWQDGATRIVKWGHPGADDH